MNRCFVCSKELTPVQGGEERPQFYDAVTFSSPGNYGSRIYDADIAGLAPYTPFRLVLVVCDDCLVERKELILELETIRRAPIEKYTTWEPVIEDVPS